MKLELSPLAVAAGVGVVVLGVLLWKVGGKAGQLAQATAQALNPVNPDNAAASAVNAVGGALATEPDSPGKSADGNWRLGAWVFDVLHPDTTAAVNATTR